MDNATAEYSFVTSFFSQEPPAPSSSSKENNDPTLSPTVKGGFDERRLAVQSEMVEHTSRARANSLANPVYTTPRQSAIVKMERAPLDAIWKQIMDPVLEYCQVCNAKSPSDAIYIILLTWA